MRIVLYLLCITSFKEARYKVDTLSHPNFIKVAKPEFSTIRIYLKDCFMKEQVVQDFYCTLCLGQAGNNIS